ncbi:histidine phosphatase family protein [Arenicella xantha]|uniref:Broad specificity phosphatase PhoE n=1 Tax=Arenicella xantha TaxID=644221 RepID=A0A395JJ87_9GAMM|nr:histidine phosphatase family protein [Arenicella xantha]RBP49121.1 broad specificity phosphatase PhoE [Arenicella xantha]
MSSIYLIRHGQASFGQENYDQLSELGQRQASRLGEVVGSRLGSINRVVLGTMHRHRQTAENCLIGFGLDLGSVDTEFDAGWNEYDHQDILAQFRPEFATAAGMTEFIRQQPNPKQAFEQDFNAAMNRWIAGEHDDYVESWHDYRARVQQALARTVERHAASTRTLVFTSGGPISLVSQQLLGVPSEAIMRMNWTLMNCAVTKLVSTKDRLFLSSLNEHSHFEGDAFKHFITYT